MTNTIIIKKEGKDTEEIECKDYFIILSDPGDFKGIQKRTSTESITRIIGWLQWFLYEMQFQANVRFRQKYAKRRHQYDKEPEIYPENLKEFN